MLVTTIFSFSQNVFYPSSKYVITYSLLSACALKLGQSIFLSFGKELNFNLSLATVISNNLQ